MRARTHKTPARLKRTARGLLLTGIAVLLVLLAGCATHNLAQAPNGQVVVQPGGFNNYTPQQDIQLGEQAEGQVQRTMPLLPDSSPVVQYVQQLGHLLASYAPGPNKWPFSFHVVNAKDINAFALPGGPVYVNLGTIQAADDEGELAGVIAHEISHVVLRHSTQQASKASVAQLPLAILGVVLPQGAAGQLAGVGLSLGAQTLFLKYSRTDEQEADELGAQIMYNAGFDPYDLAEFFSKLEQQGGPGVPQFLSDHPDPGNRIDSIKKIVANFPRKRYRGNSAEFERVKATVGNMHPMSAEEVAAYQKAHSLAVQQQ
ncbi:MAG TPA: M48 family metallopeptidase [Terriglobales bacterium]|nr:M48 family metallopeptidase [Terriglobales bacterium]